MFTLTRQARSVVRRVTSHPVLSARSGLRIASAGPEAAPMQVAAVRGPQPGDAVVEHDGARVFLGPRALERLQGRTVDAVTDQAGRVQFVLKARS
ncbi:Fe-S cluster assembly protein HesB [Nocardioides sediminis]|uniref:Fe-S cluster assembly protein HesB n=1 Tax=Nocardioides sediminis TaxID=433648 RepID=UPI000D2FD560|nr:Fe-S cluster assembly protein HesB [Nocardioides sediminis]